MFALVKTHAQKGLSVADMPTPEPGVNDIRIKISHAAICGTDVHIYNWNAWAQETVPIPMIIGHEYVGIIDKVGDNVTKLKPGMRVSGEGHIICGVCRNCRSGHGHRCNNTLGVGVNRPGAYCQYLVIPAQNAYEIPQSIPDEVAAILDPFGNAVHSVLSFDTVGEDVLITGAGPIGLMAVGLCRKIGARHVVVSDPQRTKREKALEMGATRAVDPGDTDLKKVVHELGMTEGFDVGLEMSGAPSAYEVMLEVLRNGAKIALLGIPPKPFAIDWTKIIFKSLLLKGVYGREMFDTWYKGIALIESGLDISGIITHRLPITEFADGFKAIEAGKAIKVVFSLDCLD